MDETTRRLRQAYDTDAQRRGELEPAAWRCEIVDRFVDAVRDHGGDLPVLELGCGAGQMARRIADAGLRVTAVDLSPAMVERTVARGVDAIVADFSDLPFADATFGGALAFNSFVHTPPSRLPELFAEVRRVLADDAVLTVVVWGGAPHQGPIDGEWLDPPRFFSILSDEALLEQPTPGFDRVDVALLHEQTAYGFHPQVLTLRAI